MSEDHTATVVDALKRLEDFSDITAKDVTITRLGGLTNLVHKVSVAGQNVVVRIPGAGTEEYIDRAVEAHNAQVAADAGVSAELLHADPESGIMITRYIDNTLTMTPDLFTATAGAPARAGDSLARLHRSGKEFRFRFELFAMIEEYLNVLSGKDVNLPDGYHDIVKAAEPVRDALNRYPAALAPCHCDPLCENFLDDGKRMWIVDWEYSGMNDPLWDLGDLSVEAGFSDTHDAEMMQAYFGRSPTAAETGRMVVYKAMCDLLWTLWGLIQLADENPAEDFWAYATGRFDRCKALMQHPDFDRHVAAVRENQA